MKNNKVRNIDIYTKWQLRPKIVTSGIFQRLYSFISTLVVASTVDRESVSTYILTVLAEDSGLAPLSDRTDVEITVIGEFKQIHII